MLFDQTVFKLLLHNHFFKHKIILSERKTHFMSYLPAPAFHPKLSWDLRPPALKDFLQHPPHHLLLLLPPPPPPLLLLPPLPPPLLLLPLLLLPPLLLQFLLQFLPLLLFLPPPPPPPPPPLLLPLFLSCHYLKRF